MATPHGEDPPQPPPPPPAPIVFTGERFTEFANLPTYDIRNGPPEAAVSLLVKSTIPTSYRWVKIANMVPERALSYVDAYIAEHYEYLTQHPFTGMDDPKKRKAAICLGVARAVATSYYRLEDTDLVDAETAVGHLSYRAAAAAVGATPAVEEAIVFADGTPADVRNRMTTNLEYTDLERAVITGLIPAVVGIIPVQGYSYLSCSHHYISRPGHQSFKAFYAIEKQQWKDTKFGTWFTDDEELIRDWLWHKSTHPVNLTIKLKSATSESVKEMLVTAGAGSAAARLPATEAGVKAAEAYMQLFDTLRPLFTSFQGSIDTSLFELAIRTLRSLPPGEDGAPAGWARVPGVPEFVNDRKTCIRWLGEIVGRNSAMAAQCYGFYCAMCDAGMSMGSAATTDSLRNAFSLKKLMSTHVPTYTLGYMSYADYASARKKARKAGEYFAPIMRVV